MSSRIIDVHTRSRLDTVPLGLDCCGPKHFALLAGHHKKGLSPYLILTSSFRPVQLGRVSDLSDLLLPPLFYIAIASMALSLALDGRLSLILILVKKDIDCCRRTVFPFIFMRLPAHPYLAKVPPSTTHLNLLSVVRLDFGFGLFLYRRQVGPRYQRLLTG